MAEVPNSNGHETSDATKTKRKGFFSNLFGRSSKHASEKKDDQEKKGGFMNSFMDNARQAATKEVEHVAEHEATKHVEQLLDNNNNNSNSGSQPTDATNPTSSAMPDTSTMTPSDAVDASTNWAKRMVGSAQQKMQSLQNLGS